MTISGAGTETCFSPRRLARIDLFPFHKQPFASMSKAGMVHKSCWNMDASCSNGFV